MQQALHWRRRLLTCGLPVWTQLRPERGTHRNHPEKRKEESVFGTFPAQTLNSQHPDPLIRMHSVVNNARLSASLAILVLLEWPARLASHADLSNCIQYDIIASDEASEAVR